MVDFLIFLQCDSCPVNQFAPNSGASSCVPCGKGTYTSSTGSARCSTNCLFTVPDTTITYNVANLPSVSYFDGSGSTYYFNICAPFTDNTCTQNNQPITTFVCAIDDEGNAQDYGNTLSFEPNGNTRFCSLTCVVKAANKGFSLSYDNGQVGGACPSGRQTTVTFICDPSTPIGSPELVGDQLTPCDANFIWYSEAGCPMCQDSDYEMVGTMILKHKRKMDAEDHWSSASIFLLCFKIIV